MALPYKITHSIGMVDSDFSATPERLKKLNADVEKVLKQFGKSILEVDTVIIGEGVLLKGGYLIPFKQPAAQPVPAWITKQQEAAQDIADNLTKVRTIVSALHGELVCDDCGRHFPASTDLIMYDPYDEQINGRFVLKVLCAECAQKSDEEV